MPPRSVRPSYEVQWKDYYEVLGVPRDAGAGTIKAAYRRLARQYHPDGSSAKSISDAEDRFKEVAEAYEYLGEPPTREAYDAYSRSPGDVGAASAPRTDDTWEWDNDPLRAWQEMQQQPPPSHGARGGEPLRTQAPIDPLSAVKGWLEAAAVRERNHDLAGARSAAGEAMFIAMGLGAKDWPEEARRRHDFYEHRFHSESVPPRDHRPTVEPAEQSRWGGVTAEELGIALRSMALSAGAMVSDVTGLRQGAPMEGTLIGTLVRDEHRRLGIRDETTGKTVLVDFPSWGDASMAGIVHEDLGKIVQVTGMVRNWRARSCATTMSVGHYAGSPDNPGVVRAYGLRFHDAQSWLAVHPPREALQQRGRASRSVDADMGIA